jgi:major membrane immunogen (membrane-anchored lipoprotein)
MVYLLLYQAGIHDSSPLKCESLSELEIYPFAFHFLINKTTMKLKRNFFLRLLCIAMLSVALVTSCNKENSNSAGSIPAGEQKVTVSLNDDPVPNLTSVVVDIRYVEVKVDTGKIHHEDSYYDEDHEGEDHQDGEGHHGDQFGKWDTVGVTPGLYDLLKLRNGTDTVIANGLTHIGKITKIRITLGPNNTVSTDSAHSYPLPLCDASPYVYANIRSNTIDSIGGGKYVVRIDFDVARSIQFEDGNYCLKPRLKSYCEKTSGSIEGKVLPREAQAHIMVYNSADTAYAIPEDEGEFKVRGLSDGTYSVLYKATAPYQDTTLLNIQVQKGMETKLPTITLHQ